MTYGQIKDEALRLAGVDIQDKENSCFSDYLSMLPGCIMRAFADIEAREILPIYRITVKKEQTKAIGDRMSVELSSLFCEKGAIGKNSIPEIFSIVAITSAQASDYGRKIDYYYENSDTLILENADGDFNICYYPIMLTIGDIARDDTVLPVPDGICSAIPYFASSDLIMNDEPSLSSYLRSKYEMLISRFTRRESGISHIVRKFNL